MFCTNCGSEIKIAQNFCINCGASFAQQTSTDRGNNKKETEAQENQKSEVFSENLRRAIDKEEMLYQSPNENIGTKRSQEDSLELMRKYANEEPDKCINIISKLIENNASMALNPIILFFRALAKIQKGAQIYQVKNNWTDDILDLFEQSLIDLKKSSEIEPNPELFEGTFKDKMDAVALVLNGKRPGKVQQLLGRTKLKYMTGDESRVSINNQCADILIPSEEAMDIFGDVFFNFPSIIRSVFVAYMQKDNRNRHYIKVALFEEPSIVDAFGEPHKIKGYIDIYDDGTFQVETEKKK